MQIFINYFDVIIVISIIILLPVHSHIYYVRFSLSLYIPQKCLLYTFMLVSIFDEVITGFNQCFIVNLVYIIVAHVQRGNKENNTNSMCWNLLIMDLHRFTTFLLLSFASYTLFIYVLLFIIYCSSNYLHTHSEKSFLYYCK